jgi:predicted secreted protein
MADYKVGDEVRVFHRDRYTPGAPSGYAGKVTKAARRYATAEYERTRKVVPWHDETETVTDSVEFDMATGVERGYQHNGRLVKTPAQVAEDERRKEAIYVLKEAGIEFRLGRERSFTLEQVEALAEVVKDWED